MAWDPFDLADILIFVLALTMLGYTVKEIVIKPNKWIRIFPLTFWAVHLAIFYGVIITGNITGRPLVDDALIVWSTVQRLHGVITMFYMTWIASNSTMNCGKD